MYYLPFLFSGHQLLEGSPFTSWWGNWTRRR